MEFGVDLAESMRSDLQFNVIQSGIKHNYSFTKTQIMCKGRVYEEWAEQGAYLIRCIESAQISVGAREALLKKYKHLTKVFDV